jgi:hypothetical protein
MASGRRRHNTHFSRPSRAMLVSSGFGTIRSEIKGQGLSALPPKSDIDLFSDGERVINFYAEVPNRTRDFCVTQK